MYFYNAKQQFNENFRLFGNAQTDPEKYNLYAGLDNMAQGLEQMQHEIETMQRKIRQIEEKLSRVS